MNEKEKIAMFLKALTPLNKVFNADGLLVDVPLVENYAAQDSVLTYLLTNEQKLESPKSGQDLIPPFYLLFQSEHLVIYYLSENKFTLLFKDGTLERGMFEFTLSDIAAGLSNKEFKIITENEAKAWSGHL